MDNADYELHNSWFDGSFWTKNLTQEELKYIEDNRLYICTAYIYCLSIRRTGYPDYYDDLLVSYGEGVIKDGGNVFSRTLEDYTLGKSRPDPLEYDYYNCLRMVKETLKQYMEGNLTLPPLRKKEISG